MIGGLSLDLRSVSSFTLVQADSPEGSETVIIDEKDFTVLGDALRTLRKSEAPVKYLKFNHSGITYSLYPIEDSEEFKVVKTPVLN